MFSGEPNDFASPLQCLKPDPANNTNKQANSNQRTIPGAFSQESGLHEMCANIGPEKDTRHSSQGSANTELCANLGAHW